MTSPAMEKRVRTVFTHFIVSFSVSRLSLFLPYFRVVPLAGPQELGVGVPGSLNRLNSGVFNGGQSAMAPSRRWHACWNINIYVL